MKRRSLYLYAIFMFGGILIAPCAAQANKTIFPPQGAVPTGATGVKPPGGRAPESPQGKVPRGAATMTGTRPGGKDVAPESLPGKGPHGAPAGVKVFNLGTGGKTPESSPGTVQDGVKHPVAGGKSPAPGNRGTFLRHSEGGNETGSGAGAANTTGGGAGIGNIRRKRYGETVLGSAILDAVLLPGPDARKHLDDEAKKRLEDFAAQQKAKAPAPGIGQMAGGIVGIEIVRVQTRGGNDPLSTNDPTSGGDTTGRTQSTGGITGGAGTTTGGGGGGTIACTPSSAPFDDLLPSLGINALEASMDINIGAGSCTVMTGSNGTAIFFQTPPNGSPPGTAPGQIEVFSAGAGWSLVAPSVNGMQFASGSTQTFFLQELSSGHQVKVIANVTQSGPRGFSLNVTSVTQL